VTRTLPAARAVGEGDPPPFAEASQNLQAPEIAGAVAPPAALPHATQRRIDGRSLRKTGRTLQLATRVSWEFDTKLRYIVPTSFFPPPEGSCEVERFIVSFGSRPTLNQESPKCALFTIFSIG
jgi:hypothetical protein